MIKVVEEVDTNSIVTNSIVSVQWLCEVSLQEVPARRRNIIPSNKYRMISYKEMGCTCRNRSGVMNIAGIVYSARVFPL